MRHSNPLPSIEGHTWAFPSLPPPGLLWQNYSTESALNSQSWFNHCHTTLEYTVKQVSALFLTIEKRIIEPRPIVDILIRPHHSKVAIVFLKMSQHCSTDFQ